MDTTGAKGWDENGTGLKMGNGAIAASFEEYSFLGTARKHFKHSPEQGKRKLLVRDIIVNHATNL